MEKTNLVFNDLQESIIYEENRMFKKELLFLLTIIAGWCTLFGVYYFGQKIVESIGKIVAQL